MDARSGFRDGRIIGTMLRVVSPSDVARFGWPAHIRACGSILVASGVLPEPHNKWDTNVATEKSQNVQDVFLNHVRKSKTPVTVFLVNGVKLQGIITWFDNFSVLLRRDGHTQLVYKHAISTVMPGAPIQLFDASKVEAAAQEAGSGGGAG